MIELLVVFGAALLFTLVLGPILIPLLNKLKFNQSFREDGPRSHFAKMGTPTMGGVIFLIPLIVVTLIFSEYNSTVLTIIIITVGCGTIGFLDDFIKVVLKRPLGLKARYKLGGQIILASFLAGSAVFFLNNGTHLFFPVVNFSLDLGILYFPFVLLILVATTNAVNLTDGLDGLAAGGALFTAVGYMIISYMGNYTDLSVFASALAGGCIGFLVFNFYPARVFMGDTGSLALGAAIAGLAVLTKTEIILVLIGGIFVIETLSVILQVISFKIFGKRLFLMSPLHHHFELAGWPEEKIVISFWVFAAVFSVLGVLSVIKL